MKRTILSLIAICSTSLALQAQMPQSYTLKSCLEYGLQNNYSLRITRNEEQVSKNNATLGNAGYLPTLDLSASYKGTVEQYTQQSAGYRRTCQREWCIRSDHERGA